MESSTTLYAEIERHTLQDLLETAKAYYENPENVKAFEEWQKSDEGKEYAKRHGLA